MTLENLLTISTNLDGISDDEVFDGMLSANDAATRWLNLEISNEEYADILASCGIDFNYFVGDIQELLLKL